MAKTCAVPSCRNPKHKEKVLYHRFPRDVEIARKWVVACRRHGKINPETARVCSRHFTSNAYKRDLKNELMNLPCKKVLKETAVPTLLLKPGQEEPTPNDVDEDGRDERAAKRARRLEVQRLLACSENRTSNEEEEAIEVGFQADHLDNTPEADFQAGHVDNTPDAGFQADHVDSNPQPFHFKHVEHKGVQCTRMKNLPQLRACNRLLREKNKALLRDNAALQQKLKKMSSVDPDSASLRNPPKKVPKWAKEDISNALIIKTISSRCYNFLRNKNILRLPGATTIREWIKMTPTLQADSLKVLQETAHSDPEQAEHNLSVMGAHAMAAGIEAYDREVAEAAEALNQEFD